MTTTPPTAGPPQAPGQGATTSGQRQLFNPRIVAVAALAVSALMGIVAFSALGLAIDARGEATDARSEVDALRAAQDRPVPPAPSETPSPVDEVGDVTPSPDGEPVPTESATPLDVLNPQAVYDPHYRAEVLNPQVTDDVDVYVDLDEPRVGTNVNRADIELEYTSWSNEVPSITLPHGDQSAAAAASPATTPEDCADLIRTSPLPGDAETPAQRGTVLCITTSPAQASALGMSQRMAVVEVTALGDEGRLTLKVSTWEVPQ